MLIRGLYEVAIPVRQLKNAESFYRDALGLEVGLRDEQRKWLFLRVGGAAGMIVLQECAPGFPRHHFAFAVSESHLQEAEAVLRKCDVPARGPIFHGWMPGTSLYFEDVDGHELEFFAPRQDGRKSNASAS